MRAEQTCRLTMDYLPEIEINGKNYPVPKNLRPNTCLGDFIRENAHLTGTKISCREGACGACVVSARVFDPVLNSENIISINSCLVPAYSALGMRITTVEGLGDKRKGYHQVQERLANYNGTQCGFCSPGFVTSMYSLLENKPSPPTQDIEDLFDGNVCRCTGYRPILDAMKSFSCDNANHKYQKKNAQNKITTQAFPITGSWYHPSSIKELLAIMQSQTGKKTRLVFGNTSTAIYKFEGPFEIFINLRGISELYQYEVQNNPTFGSNISLNHLINILCNMKNHPAYKVIASHVRKIATHHVRNAGCWAGNLMMKHKYHDFPSDLFVIFECIGAELVIADTTGKTQCLRPEKFLQMDMGDKAILTVKFPKHFSQKQKYNSFKIMPRAQSAHAYVSAAFLAEVEESNDHQVLSRPSIVFGGLSKQFIHAKKTEEFLVGKKLADVSQLQGAVKVLFNELVTEDNYHLASSQYRKQLAVNLFYKFVLSVLPKNKKLPRVWTASEPLFRPISSGKQTYETVKSEWPLNQPITKIEAKAQCSGEAEYIPDIVRPHGTLYAAFVISSIGNALITNIDATEALKIPGVLGFLTDKDIPGENQLAPMSRTFFYPEPEELFCSGKVMYAGQALGLIVAESLPIAQEASRKVKVQYKSLGPPVLTIKDALKKPECVTSMQIMNEGDVDGVLAKSKNKISGETEIGTQFHFHLETQVCLSIPNEEGFLVHASTQWTDASQQSIAQVLGVKRSSIHLELRRLGGAYGGKVSRNFHTASACTLAAQKFNSPVYLQMDLATNLEMMGKRCPFQAQYEVGFNDNGKLEAVKLKYVLDYGCHLNDPVMPIVMAFSKNVYECHNWNVTPQIVRTNLPSNTYCRTPGSVKGVFVAEVIMEHIAKVLKKNPLDVKYINMPIPEKIPNTPGIRDIVDELKISADIAKREKEISLYNKENLWKKRGLATVPMKYHIGFYTAKFNAIVTIFNDGGSVAVSHGGIECGQGINTKVAQVCAYTLGVPLELVTVRPNNTFINPNSSGTVAATTSEINCMAVIECCKILLKRIQPIREQMPNASWKELIHACFNNHIDLSARFMTGPPNNLPSGYFIYGATCAEAEIDVLTGESQILRVDLMFDCGQSLSPEVDIGQIEGSFVMGMGMFLLENAKYDFETGKNITNGTWEYPLPTTKDIPVDFRITMLKNSKNQTGVMKSKTAGEPPLCMSSVALFAIQNAVHEFRKEIGDQSWCPISSPFTREKTALACNVTPEKLIF